MGKKLLYDGPDISKHQGNVDIKRIRDAGCKRIAIRAGYGKNNIDQKYVVNAQACYNLGVDVMLYWFSYAYNVSMAKREAEYAIAQAKKYWASCPIAYDFEYDSLNYARKNGVIVSKKLATDMAVAFLSAVKSAGYIPVLYANRDYLRNYLDAERIDREVGGVYLWFALYSAGIPAKELEAAHIWQYTSKGSLPGVSGNVDLNHYYTDFEQTVKAERKESLNINIMDFQRAANADGCRDQSGSRLVEDGLDGPKTRYVRQQVSLKAKRAGVSYKVGSTGELVKFHQRRCGEILQSALSVDGKFGKDTRNATIQLQKKLGLAVDGVAGYNTLQAEFYN